jgi:MFS family permease
VTGHLLVTDLAWLVVLRLLLGAAEALYFVAGFAALTDLAPPGRAGEALSYNSLALYLGIAIGPVVGQGLLDRGGFPLVWIGAAVLLAVAAVLAARVPETLEPASGPSPPAPLIHPAALLPGPRCRPDGVCSPAPLCWRSGPPSSPRQCSRRSSAASRRRSAAVPPERPACSSTWDSVAAPPSWAWSPRRAVSRRRS